MDVYGAILLIVLVFYIIICIKNNGILFLFNYARIGLIIWMLSLGLYDLSFSELFQPDILVNIVCTIVIINFAFLLKIIPDDTHKLVNICKNTVSPKRGFLCALYFSLALGLIAFAKNYNSGLLRFFSSNKGMRADIQLSYFFHMLVVVSICFYILFRIEKKKSKKYYYLALAIITIFIEYTNLARGPILFWCTGIISYEILRYVVNKGKYKISAKHLFIFFLILGIGIWGFGVVGDSRTSNIFGMTATQYYKMPSKCPRGFTWVYIYITSPLENLRYSLNSQVITDYSLFNKLLYPIIKFIANIFGQGAKYANYVNSFNSISPYLWNKVGLNMSTFVSSAYQDADMFGLFVYLAIYDIIGLFIHRITVSNKITNISKLIIIPLLWHISLWSVFTSSILGVISIWSDIVFVLFWNLCNRITLIRQSRF